MLYTYKPRGICPRLIKIELEGDVVKDVYFEGGCSGNLQGITALVKGQKVSDVTDKIKNIRCGFKSTSCPDQLAKALEEAMESMKSKG